MNIVQPSAVAVTLSGASNQLNEFIIIFSLFN